MNIFDSSIWINFFLGKYKGTELSSLIKERETQFIPSVVIYEVFRRLNHLVGREDAETAAKTMQNGTIIDLNGSLAVAAADYGLEFKLPLADSIIYATARQYGATLWTLDGHFEGLEDVRYLGKTQSL